MRSELLVPLFIVAAGCTGEVQPLPSEQGDAGWPDPGRGALCVSPPELDLGTLEIGSARTESVELTNCGRERLTLAGVTSDAGWLSVDLGIVELAVGASVQLPVRVEALTPGPLQGVLAIDHEDGPTTIPVRAHVTEACALELQPETLRYALGSLPNFPYGERSVALVNRGTGPCTVVETSSTSREIHVHPDVRVPFEVPPGGLVSVPVVYWASVGTMAVQGEVRFRLASGAPLVLQVLGSPGETSPCEVRVDPPFVGFGLVAEQPTQRRSLTVTNTAVVGRDCRIESIEPGPGFAEAGFTITTPDLPQELVGEGASSIEVSFTPRGTGPARSSIVVRTSSPDAPELVLAVEAEVARRQLCVDAETIDFGRVGEAGAERALQLTACGERAVEVAAIELAKPHGEILLPDVSAFRLEPGETRTVAVRYAPRDEIDDEAEILVRSNDRLRPAVRIPVQGGAPPAVGDASGLLIWHDRLWLEGGVQLETVVLPQLESRGVLPGDVGCPGCHAVSPDGRYVLYDAGRALEAIELESGVRIEVGISTDPVPTGVSFAPDPETVPPYQFVYTDQDEGLSIGAIGSGFLRRVAGADDPRYTHRMASWGRPDRIAFARGDREDGALYRIDGPCDLMIIDAAGGVAEPVVGASGDGGAHYAPAFSPDGRWIAYTHSARGRTTYAAPDARLRLVRADQSGAVDDLAAANLPLGVAGSSSYPAWSPSGRTLAFTRRIVTGRHDAYNRRPADAYIARFDPVTGTVGPGVPVPGQNTYFVERTPVFIP
ncbi:MAG: choice-of-anchor D domain-containing protein [Deltaproteobacteria bacterium]|nr:choice-of-anchor D domain-containing protein [Deltaproteobacteria bacterium]